MGIMSYITHLIEHNLFLMNFIPTRIIHSHDRTQFPFNSIFTRYTY